MIRRRRWTTGLAAGVSGLLLWGCSGGGVSANLPMQNVGPWSVGAGSVPDPPRVGDNTIVVVVRDASGKPMRGSVDVMVSMAAMGSMVRMESRGKVSASGPGVYRASYGIAMGGEWDVEIHLRPDSGPPAEARYRISTSIPGLSFVGGTPATVGGNAPTTQPNAAQESAPGIVSIDAARRHSLGIRTEAVQVRDLATTLRAPGRVAYDESRQAEISLKFGGWIRSLFARVTGQTVRRGEVLFTVYSPELWSAQQEFLEAQHAANAARSTPTLDSSSGSLAQASRERLMLWDISASEVDSIVRSDKPIESMPIRSPVSGVVTEKNIVEGSAFTPGQTLFRLAQLDPIWVIASVSQQDAPLVRTGMGALVRDPYGGTSARRGTVSFVYPSLDSLTRTLQVRVAVANPGGRLQPGTFVDVDLVTPQVRRLAVPESAVLPTGKRAVVFVDLGDGRLAPRDVELGLRAGGYYEVRTGLQAGEVVVTSGNFLVASESKLRSAAQKW